MHAPLWLRPACGLHLLPQVSLRRKVKEFFLLENACAFVAAAGLRPSPAAAGEPAPQSEGILPTGKCMRLCGCGRPAAFTCCRR
jgi:hypothetical protein